MIGHGWVTLKQAQEALRAGRLDEAHQLLGQPHVQGHRRCLELLQQLMRAYVERGEKHLRNDEMAKAWVDLLKAEEIGITDNAPIRLRQSLTRIGLAEVRALINAGQPDRALESIQQLRERAVRQPELDALEHGAKELAGVNDYTARGEFPQALEKLAAATKWLPAHRAVIDQLEQSVRRKYKDFTPLITLLQHAAQNERWPELLQLSEKCLALAPNHAEVRRLRGRAWKAIEPPTIMLNRPLAEPPAVPVEQPPKKRLILWIDGVGGYLLVMDDEVTIGQAGPDALADIAVQADISRLHARLSRDTEGYVIDAQRLVLVNNRGVEKRLLRSGDRLTLGTSCQLAFRQEVPISASARLDAVSGHRFGLAVDGVLLMAETLVLGPSEQAHVCVPDLQSPVILFRNKQELGIRAGGEELFLNGELVKGRGILTPGCHLTGTGLSLSLEQVTITKISSRYSR